MTTHEQPFPECFLDLNCAVPPTLERVLGYALAPPPAGPHYLGLCWAASVDEAWFEDGRYASIGSGFGYLAWIRHAAVGPYLPRAAREGGGPIDIGSSDTEATHMLLLDRAARRIRLGPIEHVRASLEGQWSGFDSKDPDDMARLKRDCEAHAGEMLRRLALAGIPTPDQVRVERDAEQDRIIEMCRWLDATDEARAARLAAREAAGNVVAGWYQENPAYLDTEPG